MKHQLKNNVQLRVSAMQLAIGSFGQHGADDEDEITSRADAILDWMADVSNVAPANVAPMPKRRQ